MAAAMQVGPVPDALRSAVAEIIAIEQQHTWSRYSFRIRKTKSGEQLVNHMEKEVVLPLGKIQNDLQESNNRLGSIWPLDATMMGMLGALWECLARTLGKID